MDKILVDVPLFDFDIETILKIEMALSIQIALAFEREGEAQSDDKLAGIVARTAYGVLTAIFSSELKQRANS